MALKGGDIMTKAERAIEFLKARGSLEVKSSSRKYVKMTNPYGARIRPENGFLWIGKSGAVRSGATISDSISITDAIERMIKREESK